MTLLFLEFFCIYQSCLYDCELIPCISLFSIIDLINFSLQIAYLVNDKYIIQHESEDYLHCGILNVKSCSPRLFVGILITGKLNLKKFCFF